ncbi:kelch domain-containing protein 3 [Macrosteles quadrilineatus]|uniref:kelch domain-containing protein 3 n=1 Tax=Macrosteles quadrilineatus TaxID=74068 RepID=UPI0023E103B4|nr:kelch domain-containing protein 3 [Macrosteles quadrilineatus]
MYWTVRLSGGPQRVNHAAVIIGDKVYSFGGYCSGENYRLQRPIDVHILNTVTLRWKVFLPPASSKHEAPYLRYGHTAVVYGTKVYVWGGRNDDSACNKLYCFDTENLAWSCIKTQGIRPGARDGHSACVIGDDMYIFGGFEDDEDRFSQDVYKLCLRTFTWSYVYTTGDPPSYRDFHSATAIGNRMFVFGGRGDQTAPQHSMMEIYCNSIVYLDVVEKKWCKPATTGDIPVGRRSHSAFVYKDHIYIFGGFNSLKGMHFNDLHRFNPYTMTWQCLQPLGEPPSKRRRQSCVVSGSRMYLFGGTSPVREDELPPPNYYPDHDHLESRLNDHDDLHILDFEPSLQTLCLMSVIKHQLDITYLPDILKWEFYAMTTHNSTIQRLKSSNQG